MLDMRRGGTDSGQRVSIIRYSKDEHRSAQ